MIDDLSDEEADAILERWRSEFSDAREFDQLLQLIEEDNAAYMTRLSFFYRLGRITGFPIGIACAYALVKYEETFFPQSEPYNMIFTFIAFISFSVSVWWAVGQLRKVGDDLRKEAGIDEP
ncbi:hypothetical protein [Rhodopirellula sallentina]|uniref:hypothetical protein n=1 Tax=Rhodopirellula sallentina TaxID=1263869 RepID=UPI0005C7B519|nr:hypothetical protein [Rhodopirellula sallentina]